MGFRTMLAAIGVGVMALGASGAAAGELPAAEFLRLAARRSTLNDSYARLWGRISHLRKNAGKAEYYPIYFGVIFSPGWMHGQLILDGREYYDIERSVGSASRFAVKPAEGQPAANSLLDHLGLEISDLSMGFLDDPLRKEEDSERVKTVDCRVLLLDAPGGGTVKVWISREYLFPVRAEFYGPGAYPEKKPDRTLEVTGFKKIDQYYVVTDLAILGREWRTRIAFDRTEVGKNDAPEAAKVFQPVPGAQATDSSNAKR